MRTRAALALASLLVLAAPGARAGDEGALALRAAKALTCAASGPQVIDHAVLVMRGGRIEAVGPASEVPIPADARVLDLGSHWIMPGMIDLHSHVAGTWDLNDMVYLTNPGLRVSTAVVPGARRLDMGLAGGVTAVLFIPGSGTNIGGQGVLLKAGFEQYERMELRNPGSLKLAQWGNPEGWTVGVGKTFENWNTRHTIQRGLNYAEAWRLHEEEGTPRPEKDIQWEVFRDLLAGRTQVSTHTQIFQVVLATLTMVKGEFGLDVYIDHGTFDGYRAGHLAEEAGVAAILGPRQIDPPSEGMMRFAGTNPERVQGVAAGYQERGHTMVGFNTDSPGVPQQELSLQAAMGVRYGFDNRNLEAVRGLTIVPAMAAGLDHRIGSLEPGKDADVLVLTGDPADPRSQIDAVWVEGERVYDSVSQGRRW